MPTSNAPHRSAWWLGVALVSLGGCAGLWRTPDPPLVNHWPAGVAVRDGALGSSTGCTIDYRTFAPHAPVSDVWVVLAHGFLRDQARMRDLALALAAAGVPVATLKLCNMRLWSGSHSQNGRDMRALTVALGAPRVVYAGFSAGALAAVLAARADPAAVGILALDLVDAGGVGARAARGFDRPLVGLSGAPTNCNARDNGRAVFAAAPAAQVRRFPSAGHCDFESPTDRLCLAVCDEPDPDADAGPGTVSARAAIIDAARAEVLALVAGVSAPAADRSRGRIGDGG